MRLLYEGSNTGRRRFFVTCGVAKPFAPARRRLLARSTAGVSLPPLSMVVHWSCVKFARGIWRGFTVVSEGTP
jgi:hypothetical protein